MSDRVRRRWPRLALAVALLLATIGVVVSFLLFRPGADAAQSALSAVAGRPVTFATYSISLGRRLTIEVTDLRVHDSKDANAPDLLQVPRVRVEARWPQLLAGQLVPARVWLDAPRAYIEVSKLSDRERGEAQFESPAFELDVERGRVEIRYGEGAAWIARDLRIESDTGFLGRHVRARTTGRIEHDGDRVAEFDVDVRTEKDAIEVRGSVAALDLGELEGLPVGIAGHASGPVALRYADETLYADVNLALEGLRIRPDPETPEIAAKRARLTAKLRATSGALRIDLAPLRLDELGLDGRITFDWENERMRGDVTVHDFEPAGAGGLNPVTLLARYSNLFATIADRTRAGQVYDISIQSDVALSEALDIYKFRRRITPGELTVHLRARDGVFGGDALGPRLAGLSGELELRGEVMHVRGVRFTSDGRPMPELDVRINGIHRLASLPDAENRAPLGAGEEIPGLGAALRSFSRGASDSGDSGASTQIALSNVQLEYPPVLRPLRDGSGELRFGADGWTLTNGRAVLGGAPVRLTGSGTENSLAFSITFEDGTAPPRTTPARDWIRGTATLNRIEIAGWVVDDVKLRVRGRGAEIEIESIDGRLARGRVFGHGEFSLAEAGEIPYTFGAQLIDADAGGLAEVIGYRAEDVQGTASANGRLSIQLNPGATDIADLDAVFNVHLENGSLSNLPLTFALARLPSLQGVRGLLGRPLPYDSIDAELRLKDGVLAIQRVKLLGPELRLLVDGTMDLNTPEKSTDLVVAVMFLQTVDRLLGSVPIVRNVMLGDRQNLIATYFRVQGPRDDLSAQILPPETLSKTANFATGVIKGGLKRLISIIPGTKSGDTPAPDAQSESGS